MLKAVLFRSERRFESFRDRLEKSGVQVTVLDFDGPEWVEYDFSTTDIVIYFPEFTFSSNHPLALYRVHDNLMHIHQLYPRIQMFPDPHVIFFYCDKYRQHLFLKAKGFPYPETYALNAQTSLDLVEHQLGYPMVLKNRFGAGGDYVFKVDSRNQLEHYFRLSQMDMFRLGTLRHFFSLLSKRLFYYFLVRIRRMPYPFLSAPLLAQRFISHDRDIKTVVGDGKVVEAHWRRKATNGMWKVNIDGGGIGEWSYVPPEITKLSERLAQDLDTSWLNIDIIQSEGSFLITEFSPVWHHYAYKEKSSFVYKDDYNIEVPLEISLDLERIIVESFLRRASNQDNMLHDQTQV